MCDVRYGDKESVNKTKVQKGESFRTTIPKWIADKLGLGDGDQVEWDLKTKGTHAGKAFLTKAEENEEEDTRK